MIMKSITWRLQSVLSIVRTRSIATWTWYRAQKTWKQIGIAVVAIALLIAIVVGLGSLGKKEATADQLRTVSLATAGSLGGVASGSDVLGTIRSVTEANLLAESGGTVRAVRTTLGASVPAGFVIAELENASQRAAVLQAEGAYDAAIAARSGVSSVDATTAARNAYRSAFAALDYALESQVDSVYGAAGAFGPRLLIGTGDKSEVYFSQTRSAIDQKMSEWRAHLATADNSNPETLLAEASAVISTSNELISNLSTAANQADGSASATQLANLASARASVNAQAAAVASAREAYRSKSVSSTASVDASVKQALGSLRGAQAQLEKTLVRAPISGTVNFLPIRVGDYVTAYTHVATVAQNGSLEIVTSISEDERAQLSIGEKVQVDAAFTGVITSISPALDPVTRQIEVHIAVLDTNSSLVNGQAVHITLPGKVAAVTDSQGPLLLPLTAVKLRTGDRVVFTVNEEGRLVGHAVTIGEVRGNRIEVLNGISPDTRIVTDARGLSEGQKVSVADLAAI